MDETPVWCDMISETTVDAKGKKTITLKSTGHKKSKSVSVSCRKGQWNNSPGKKSAVCFTVFFLPEYIVINHKVLNVVIHLLQRKP